jgi:hypothetical protein
VAALYGYYNDKPWDKHKSLGALYYAPMPSISFTRKDDIVRQVAAVLPGVGVERSLACSIKWHGPAGVEEMVNAPLAEWETVPGIGKGIARKAWEAIHGCANINLKALEELNAQ